MRTAEYRLFGIRKEYAGRTVVDIDELEIYRGEIFALVGPSGAGKSTLLRLLNFLESPSTGTIEFMGQRISRIQDVSLTLRRQVTTVFQQPILLNRSVQANVHFGLGLRGVRTIDGVVHRTLSAVGLDKIARQPARSLSGGEAQRVALARAMVIEPQVLLLDEPTANLDPYNVCLIEDIIRHQNEQRGTTIVLVTHNVFQAKRLATRVGLLLNGKVIEVAEKEIFFERPADPRTKAFISGELVC